MHLVSFYCESVGSESVTLSPCRELFLVLYSRSLQQLTACEKHRLALMYLTLLSLFFVLTLM